MIDPAKLKEIDPTEIALPFGDEEKAGEDKKGKVQETEWSSVKNGSVRKKTAGRAGKKTGKQKGRCGGVHTPCSKRAGI